MSEYLSFSLEPILTKEQKPVLRKKGGKWSCFVRLGVTPYWAARKALALCDRLNSEQ